MVGARMRRGAWAVLAGNLPLSRPTTRTTWQCHTARSGDGGNTSRGSRLTARDVQHLDLADQIGKMIEPCRGMIRDSRLYSL
jgi:hypothetical protein